MTGTRRRSLVLVGVTLLAVLAGCSAGTGPTGGDTPTVTPAPVPTPNAGYAPGVTAGGMNETAVLRQHAGLLANRSYTTTQTLAVHNRSTGAVRWRDSQVTRVAPGGSSFAIDRNFSEPRGPADIVHSRLYYDGTTTRRVAYANGTVVHRSSHRRANVDLTRTALLGRLFHQLKNVRVDRDRDRQTVVTGTVPYPRVLPSPPNTQATGSATVTARLTPAGLVEELAVGYDARSVGGPARVRLSVQFDAIGSTAVERPGWHDR